MGNIKKVKKDEKCGKKVLTNGLRGDILIKLSGAEPAGGLKIESF